MDDKPFGIDWSHIDCLYCGNRVYLTGITKATWFHAETCQSQCGIGDKQATPDMLKAMRKLFDPLSGPKEVNK